MSSADIRALVLLLEPRHDIAPREPEWPLLLLLLLRLRLLLLLLLLLASLARY